MKKIILIALTDEIDVDLSKIKEDGFLKFYELNKNTLIYFTGVGKVNAASAATYVINKYHDIKILNIGTAGALNTYYKIGDVIEVNKVYNADADARIFGYKIGQTPREKEFYTPCNNLNIKQKKMINNVGALATTDSFIDNNNIDKFDIFKMKNIDLIDMEAIAISQVCSKFNINFSIIKVISDSPNNKNQDWESTTKLLKSKVSSFISQK